MESLNTSSTECCDYPLQVGYAVIFVNILASLLGTFANIMVWYAVLRNTQLQTLSNYFLLNLSAADLIVTAITQPLFIAHNLHSMQGQYFRAIDRAYKMTGSFGCMASILSITTISIDRLIVLKYPLQKGTILTKRRGFAIMAFTWLLAMVYTALSRAYEGTRTWIVLTFVYFGVCYLIMVSAHTHIYKLSHRFVRRRKEQVRRHSFSLLAYRKERQAAKTIAIIIAVLTLAWLPYGTGLAVTAVTGMRLTPSYLNPLLTVGFLNSCFNTLLYSWRNKEFRTTFGQLLKCQDPNLIRRESISSFYITRSRISTASSVFNDMNAGAQNTDGKHSDIVKDVNLNNSSLEQPAYVVCRHFTV